MTIKLKSRLILTISSIGFMLFESLGFLTMISLAGSTHSGSFYIVNLGIMVALIVVVNIIFNSKIKLFSIDINNIEDADRYKKHLENLGALPLRSLLLFMLLATIIQIGTNIHLKTLGINANTVNAFTGLMIAISMVASSFIYVLFDRMVLKWLYNNKVYNYPEGIKSNRQKVKNIIIPMFMSIMSAAVTFFLLFITLTNIPKGTENPLAYVVQSTLPPLLVIMGIIAILVFTWSKSTSLLYSQVITRLDEMTNGDMDITKRIIISSVDEIALISDRVNKFSELICEHINQTKNMVDEQNQENTSLYSCVVETTNHIDQISSKIDETINIVSNNDKIVNKTLETGKSLINNSSDVANQVDIQSMSVTESSAAVEEMIASINEVTKRTSIVRERTTELAEDFNDGQNKISATVDSVSHVVDLSKTLMDINGVISGIAARTNLLAMNAAIEAAHAGEAGKGFSVVADEIRKLAENTAHQTKTSSQNLKDILKEINTSLTIATETGKTFDKMRAGLTVVENETHSIAEAMEEHDKANNQVLEQLMSTTELSQKLTDISSQLTTQGNSMLQFLEELEEKSKESLRNAMDIKSSNSITQESMDTLNSVSKQSGLINQKTKELVDSFKV